MTRSGIGWDSHRLEPGRPFVLGGVTIEHDQGPVGHSDGDVLAHAVIYALLGAAGLGDIGAPSPTPTRSSPGPTRSSCWARRCAGPRRRASRRPTPTRPSC